MSASREICKLCYRVNRVGFNVPDAIWLAVVPEHIKERVVCLDCFTSLADEKLVHWCTDIALYPVSMAAHIGLTNEVSPTTPENAVLGGLVSRGISGAL